MNVVVVIILVFMNDGMQLKRKQILSEESELFLCMPDLTVSNDFDVIFPDSVFLRE